jgi:low temperature requirement protein LtrA
MKNIPIPSLEEDFTADPAELFFDLSFVFAFSRLVFYLEHSPTLKGFAEFVVLFSLIWMAWTNFTWSANAVAGNSRLVRAIFLLATAISVLMGASLAAPFGEGSVVFAVSVSAILALPILTGATLLAEDKDVLSSNLRYLLFTIVGIVLVLAGGFTEGKWQTGFWIAAVAWLIFNTLDAGGGDWLVRPRHFAERHGLIVIVGLGEVIVAIGAPAVEALTQGGGFHGSLVAAMSASGLLAGMLWWSYFDRPLPALEHRHEQLTDAKERSRFARDVYTYSHFFIVAAILVGAAALKEIMLHPSDPLPNPFRWMLFIGISGYLVGVVISIVRAYSTLAVERVVAVAALAALIALTASLDGSLVLVAVDVLLLVTLATEHYRVEVAGRRQGPR